MRMTRRIGLEDDEAMALEAAASSTAAPARTSTFTLESMTQAIAIRPRAPYCCAVHKRARSRGRERTMHRFIRRPALLLVALLAAVGFLAFTGSAGALLDPGAAFLEDDEDAVVQDGTAELRDVAVGNFLTECPQAGLRSDGARPLDRRTIDDVEKASDQGSNIRVNQDYSCMPQDETSLDVNPTRLDNIVGGTNDYRLGTGSSGFYATTDRGSTGTTGSFRSRRRARSQPRRGLHRLGRRPGDRLRPSRCRRTTPSRFFRGNDESGVFVSRSTNGGFTWSRARAGGANTRGPPRPQQRPPPSG